MSHSEHTQSTIIHCFCSKITHPHGPKNSVYTFYLLSCLRHLWVSGNQAGSQIAADHCLAVKLKVMGLLTQTRKIIVVIKSRQTLLLGNHHFVSKVSADTSPATKGFMRPEAQPSFTQIGEGGKASRRWSSHSSGSPMAQHLFKSSIKAALSTQQADWYLGSTCPGIMLSSFNPRKLSPSIFLIMPPAKLSSSTNRQRWDHQTHQQKPAYGAQNKYFFQISNFRARLRVQELTMAWRIG